MPDVKKSPADSGLDGQTSEVGLGARVRVPGDCTFFHITHSKAASQWIRRLLQELFGSAVVEPEHDARQVWARPIETGRVYACFNVGRSEFEIIPAPGKSRFFVLIRDLRDTLVSAYYSLRYSHETQTGQLAYYRWLLSRMDLPTGLAFLAETWLNSVAWVQRSWLQAGAPVFKIEECISNPSQKLGAIFRDHWGLDVAPPLLEEAVQRHSFSILAGGRAPGQEDRGSHYRKGVAGDWRNHFTVELARRFEHLYGDMLLLAGYETKKGWSDRTIVGDHVGTL